MLFLMQFRLNPGIGEDAFAAIQLSIVDFVRKPAAYLCFSTASQNKFQSKIRTPGRLKSGPP